MKTCQLILLLPVMLFLFVGLAIGQVADPTTPPPTPPVQETPPAGIPGIPGQDLPAPAQPPAAVPPGTPLPGQPADLPNLIAPAPAGGFGMPPAQPSVQATRQPAVGASNNPLLKLFDTDGDGVLSGDEVEAAPARLWELDRNLDAELSADELAVVLGRRRQQRRQGIPGYLPVEPTQAQPQLPAPTAPTTSNEAPRFEVYPLRNLDPSRTLATLQQVLKAQPDARLTYDGRTRSILALAPSSAQAKIRDTLASLLEGDRMGLPGTGPAAEAAARPEAGLPVVPRVVPLYNMQSGEVLRIVQQVYRDRIVEPREPAPAASPIPGVEMPPAMEAPTVPAGKMVIGEGADPNTIVVSAQDPLFFEVLDLIERLDQREETPGAGTPVAPEE